MSKSWVLLRKPRFVLESAVGGDANCEGSVQRNVWFCRVVTQWRGPEGCILSRVLAWLGRLGTAHLRCEVHSSAEQGFLACLSQHFL